MAKKATVKIDFEGIWYPHTFGGWRVLVGDVTVGIYREFAKWKKIQK